MLDVVTFGETMILLRPAAPGPLRSAELFARSFGGAEANMAIGLSRLGCKVGWVSRLGDDEFGRYIRNTIRGEGVDVAAVKLDPEAPTALFFKEPRPGRESRVFYYRKGSAASRMAPGDLPPDYLRGARYLHLSGITPALSDSCRALCYQAVAAARAAGVAVCFDPNLRRKLWPEAEARRVLLELAAQADVFLPGVEEAEFLWGAGTPEELAARALVHGARLVVMKLGAAGCLVAAGDRMERVPGFPVHVVDPVGAGDAFAAGFLAGLLRGLPPERAARLANACGALACTNFGDWEAAPEWADVEALLGGTAGEVTR